MPDETLVSATGAQGGATGFGPPVVPGEVGTFGPYRLVKELGKGGMGAVYAALDTRLERHLALKVMLPETAADSGAKERFLREARAAARVKHDNVVIVYEADERNGVPYIAMEFLEGYPLDAFLKKSGGLPIDQVLRVGAETAAGLDAAHAVGLIHRDIKPANLWLEAPNGRVKVLDFGLAKPLDAEVELTKSGMVVGTPAYMSPEQGRGLKLDARSDLWSLGVVLYRLCTGQMPFTGPTTMAVLMALGNDEPTPVRELNADVPEPLAELIHQLLAKKPEARPQTAAEVAQRLRAIPGRADEQARVMQPQVVYAVTPVTVAANPFEDLDSPETEMASRATSATHVEPARARAKWPWLVAGGAALVALAVATALALKGARAPDPKDDTANKDKEKEKPKQKAEVSADRRAAEWVLGLGGSVQVAGEAREFKAAADLPKGPLALTVVTLDSKPLADDGLEHLKGLKSLEHLNLNHTGVSEPGLARVQLKEHTGLQRLWLNNTRAGNKTLEAIAGFQHLDMLWLIDTQVTDAGLLHLKGCTGLIDLVLEGTKVSGPGLAALKDCKKLVTLSLTKTAVTDAGLAHLSGAKSVRNLALSGLPLTGAGLVHLKDLQNLTHLHLRDTAVTDANLMYLKELPGLTWLDVRGTPVKENALRALHTELPGLTIEYEGGVIKPIDVDRKVAEWVIARGGNVRLNGGQKSVVAAINLPKTPFALTAAHIQDTKALADGDLRTLVAAKNLVRVSVANTPISDDGLVFLARVKGLAHLDLSGTLVTGPGLAHLKECAKLELLVLSNTKLTADALAHLKDCKNLQGLFVLNVPFGDAGLAHLAEVKALKVLNVRNSGATAKVLAALAAALPACKIEHDGGVIEPKK